MPHIRTITVASALVTKQDTEPSLLDLLRILAQVLDLIQTFLILVDKFLPDPTA